MTGPEHFAAVARRALPRLAQEMTMIPTAALEDSGAGPVVAETRRSSLPDEFEAQAAAHQARLASGETS